MLIKLALFAWAIWFLGKTVESWLLFVANNSRIVSR
jgi:hypothetical protein